MKKFLLFVLFLVLGTAVQAQTMYASDNKNVGVSYKGEYKSDPVYIFKDTLARFEMPHSSMFSPKMENRDSFYLELIYCSHAEMNKDEVYLVNIFPVYSWERTPDGGLIISSSNPEDVIEKVLPKIPFKSKRVGELAYDKFGNRMAYCVPVFGSKKELIELGLLKED